MARKPRLRDLAAAAGVGVATVERVLNARGNVAPETVRRVIVAARRLGYDRPLPSVHHATIRIEVILVRPDTAFFARLNAAFQAAAPGLDRSVVLHRTFLEENTPGEIARRIERAAGEREALIVVVQDHPRIVEALEAVDRKGIPVVLLVSDVTSRGRAVYVGIDNESAGRTAGFLMRRALSGRSGSVLTLSHSGRYSVHRQRVIGFSQYFAGPDDRLFFRQCLLTRDTDDVADAVVGTALDADPAIVGIYHAGGGDAGVMKALARHRRRGEVTYVGHELSPVARASLETGAMFVVIDQQPELQVQRALAAVESLVGLRTGEVDRSPVPFRVVTPENMN